ncbi:MAG: cytochrome c maturation protein CcmE [Planctomycetes bacterium]|nr:cytochrome c maturation protein CcmE [Planctomycetota bacterium]
MDAFSPSAPPRRHAGRRLLYVIPALILGAGVVALLALAIRHGQVPRMEVAQILSAREHPPEIQVDGLPVEPYARDEQGRLMFDLTTDGQMDVETRRPKPDAPVMRVLVLTQEIPQNLWRTRDEDRGFKRVHLVGSYDRAAGLFRAHTITVKCESRYDPVRKSQVDQNGRALQP